MDDSPYKTVSTSVYKEYKFEFIHKIEEFEEMILFVNNGGTFESGTFSVEPKGDIQLKVVWKKKCKYSYEEEYVAASLVSARKLPFNIWLREGEISVFDFIEKVQELQSFPEGMELRYETFDAHCNIENLGSLISVPEDYIIDENLTVTITGTIITYQSVTDADPVNCEVVNDSVSIAKSLENLVREGKFTDVDISCGGRSFSAHKGILWARSGTFRKLLEKQESAKSNIISVDDISADVFQEGLHFIYTEKCPKLKEIPGELLHFAEKFDLANLKNICENELTQNISVGNVCGYFSLADKQNASQLRSSCVRFIKENAKLVMVTPAWKQLRKEHTDMVAEVLEAVVFQ